MIDDGMPVMGMMMPPPPSSNMPPMPPGDGGMGYMPMMHMTFFWGHRVDILFSNWPGDRGVHIYVIALFSIFVAAVLVEFLAYVPNRVLHTRTTDDKSVVARSVLSTAFVAVRTGLSYLVMLAVMSFNVGVLIVAILGHAVGFFIFGSGIVIWADNGVKLQANGIDQSTGPDHTRC